ncbi:hypothetical protein ACFMH7_004799 [Escherichia coli O8:H49]
MKLHHVAVCFMTLYHASTFAVVGGECVGHYLGNNVNYTTETVYEQFNKVFFNTRGSWSAGRQNAYEKSLLGEETGRTVYAIGVPKYVEFNGHKFFISAPNNKTVTIEAHPDWNSIWVRSTTEGCTYTSGNWVNRVANIASGSVALEINSEIGLQSGEYDIKIPYILAWGAVSKGHWATYNDVFNMIWKADNVGIANLTGYIPIRFKVENKCTLSSLRNLSIHHGSLSASDLEGHEASSAKINFQCKEPATFKFMFSPQTVDLGNNIKSELAVKFNGKNITNNIIENIINGDVTVSSKLHKSGGSLFSGPFSGSSVLYINYE